MNKEQKRTQLVYGVAIIILAIVTSFLVLNTPGSQTGTAYASPASY